MIKRYHEAPLDIFPLVQKMTDGDYALVHLFEEHHRYFLAFKRAVEEGRDVILDNSIFELGKAFDGEKYAEWIRELKPTWYIVPDCWKNGEETTRMFFEFIDKYPSLPGKRIGVAQGYTVEEVAECYRSIEPYCDMIAFNLDFSSMSGLPKHGVPYPLRMSVGRVKVLKELRNKGVINTYKPHHLLGCGVPQEVMWYPVSYDWIRSIDTCNPVIHGMEGVKYDSDLPGLATKSSSKMCDHIRDLLNREQEAAVVHNIEMFKSFCTVREDE